MKQDFEVHVTQVFRVERTVSFMVEADSPEEAVRATDEGEIDLPEWHQWDDDWRLENQEVC